MTWRNLIVVLLLAFGVFGVPSAPTFNQVQSISIREPSSEMKNAVQPVVKIAKDMSPIDRLWLQNVYLNCARVVAADGIVEEPTVTTTDSLRAVHVAVLGFIWKGMANNSPGKYRGLSEAIDGVLSGVIGDESQQLTAEKRQKAVDLYEAIAWAGLGKDA